MARASGISEDELRHMLATHFDHDSFKSLTDKEAGKFIDMLNRLYPSLKKHRRTKRKQIYQDNMLRLITKKQVKYILDFARPMGWDESNINNLVSRMFPKFKDFHDQIDASVSFRRLSLQQAQSLIEAIKNIQARSGVKNEK